MPYKCPECESVYDTEADAADCCDAEADCYDVDVEEVSADADGEV